MGVATPLARWAHRPARRAGALLLGAAAVALAAQLSFALPGTSVPQTAQTLAVLLVGAWAGPIGGAGALALYLLLGAVGLPVFAGGGSGIGALTGGSGGFLLMFPVAAALAGSGARRLRRRPGDGRRLTGLLALMLLAHGVILLGGWLRLAWLVGPVDAYAAGIAPFLAGALVKSALAAAGAMLMPPPRV
jgi:biotin transport system substrate-specific component